MPRQSKPATGAEEFGLELDAQLCFDLYAASRAVTNAYRPLLADLELTYPQYLVMLVLWERGTSTVRELGQALQLDSGTLSPLLKRLESADLLQRQRRIDDERAVQVTLTKKGHAMRAKAASVPAAIGAAMGLRPAEFSALKTALRQLTHSVTNTT